MKNARTLFIFGLLTSLFFSSIPYDVLVWYTKSTNIVDTMWKLQKNPNVVDNFTGLGRVLDQLKVNEALAVASGDGMLLYGKSGSANLFQRPWISSSNSWNTETTAVTEQSTIRWVVTKASPTRDEVISAQLIAVSTTDGLLVVTRSSNGGAWVVDWCIFNGSTASFTIGGTACTKTTSFITNTDTASRGFDLEYEKTSGDAMVVYSRNAAATNEMGYRTWNGSTWTAESPLDTARLSGTVTWIELEAKPTSGANEITALFADTNADLSALVFDGASTWGTEPTAALETALENNATSKPTLKSFDGAYESTSGDFLAAWGFNNTAGFKWVTRLSASSWGSVTTDTFAEIASAVDLASDPGSNQIIFASEADAAASSSNDEPIMARWDGSAWQNKANCDNSVPNPDVNSQPVGAGWVRDDVNATLRGIVVYSDAAGVVLDYCWIDPFAGSPTWTVGTDVTIAGASSALSTPINLHNNPFNNAQLFALVQKTSGLHVLKLTLSDTTLTWTNPQGASLVTLPTTKIYNAFGFDYNRFIPNNLTIGVTSATKVATLNSGDTNQYIATSTCTGASSCAAFTLNVSNTSVTITSIKITETGTVDAAASLSNIALVYDTDGNLSDVGSETQYGATTTAFAADQTVTFSGSLALTPGATTYYFYPLFTLASSTASTYPKGGQTINFQIAANGDVVFTGTATPTGAPATLAGTTYVLPNATSTTFGAGLSDGGRSSEAITISGYGFGAAPAGSRANCAGAVDTGCVRLNVGGSSTVADGDITAWSNTSITLTVSSTLASLGGASGLEVVSGGQSDASDLTFFVYPNVTGMAVCATCTTNAGREHASGVDTDGLVMLQGDHFGSATGTVQFTGGFGSISATIHSTVEGPCTTAAWAASGFSGNTVCIQVSTSIGDSTYTGNITLTRSSDPKTDDISFRVLPRIISNTPTSGIIGNTIQLSGNHFCQSGACPTSPNRATLADNVKFDTTTSTDADFVNQTGGAGTCNGAGAAWTDAEICVKVPSGTPGGSRPTKVTSNTSYTSNSKAFTVESTVPDDPTSLNQFKSDGSTAILTGSSTNQSTVVLKANISVSATSSIALQVEVKPVGTAFACGAGACADSIEGTVPGGGACTSCKSLTAARVDVTALSDGTKHWQARVRNTATGEFSNWVSYGGNPESATDFNVDTTAPTITFPATNTCSDAVSGLGTNSVTISWSLNESGNGQVEYSTSSTLTPSTNYPTPPAATSTSHAVSLTNLDSNTTYYFKAKSQDDAGNLATRPSSSPFCSFTTGSVTQPAKTTDFHIVATTTVLSASNTATSTFSVLVPETSPSVKSAFVEITGVSASGGTNSIEVKVNSQATKTYAIDATALTHFKIVYEVTSANLNLNDTPSTNTLTVKPSLNVYILSARIKVNYGYTP